MGFKRRAFMALMEKFVYRESLKTLDETTLEQINEDAIMSELRDALQKTPDLQGKVEDKGVLEQDIRDVVRKVVPRLRAEKERRLRLVRQ